MDNISIYKLLELYSDDSDNNCVSIDFLEGLGDKLIEMIESFINS